MQIVHLNNSVVVGVGVVDVVRVGRGQREELGVRVGWA